MKKNFLLLTMLFSVLSNYCMEQQQPTPPDHTATVQLLELKEPVVRMHNGKPVLATRISRYLKTNEGSEHLLPGIARHFAAQGRQPFVFVNKNPITSGLHELFEQYPEKTTTFHCPEQPSAIENVTAPAPAPHLSKEEAQAKILEQMAKRTELEEIRKKMSIDKLIE